MSGAPSAGPGAAPRWRWGEPLAPLRELLAAGGILAIPTESSYGLAVDPRHAAGVEAVYAVKERERGKPLPVVAADAAQVAALGVDAGSDAFRAALPLWPAALTVLLPLVQPLPAAAGAATLAVRIPDHGRLRELLAALGTALTATSANRSGEAPEVTAAGAAALLAGTRAIVVDGGDLPGGPPSTLVAREAGGWHVLRPGRFVLPPG